MVNFDGISESLALALPLHFSDRSFFLFMISILFSPKTVLAVSAHTGRAGSESYGAHSARGQSNNGHYISEAVHEAWQRPYLA